MLTLPHPPYGMKSLVHSDSSSLETGSFRGATPATKTAGTEVRVTKRQEEEH